MTFEQFWINFREAVIKDEDLSEIQIKTVEVNLGEWAWKNYKNLNDAGIETGDAVLIFEQIVIACLGEEEFQIRLKL